MNVETYFEYLEPDPALRSLLIQKIHDALNPKVDTHIVIVEGGSSSGKTTLINLMKTAIQSRTTPINQISIVERFGSGLLHVVSQNPWTVRDLDNIAERVDSLMPKYGGFVHGIIESEGTDLEIPNFIHVVRITLSQRFGTKLVQVKNFGLYFAGFKSSIHTQKFPTYPTPESTQL